MPYSVQEFAARVKAKYPAYASMADDELTQKIIAKHPEYANQVTFDNTPWTGSSGVIPKNSIGNEIADQAWGVVQGIGEGVKGAANMLMHPIDTIRNETQHMGQQWQNAEAAGQRGDVMGVLNSAAQAVPFLGSMTQDVTGKLNRGEYGKLAGNALAMRAIDAAPEAAMRTMKGAAPVVADALRGSAERQYGKVVNPAGADPLAAEVSNEMLNQNIRMRDPRAEIAAYAEKGAQAGEKSLDSAVKSMGPINASDVVGQINNAKAKLFNPETGAPLEIDSMKQAAKLDEYAQQHVLGNAKASIGPDGNLIFEMEPELALQIKRNFDKKFTSESEAPAVNAQKTVANSMRDAINVDPNAANANAVINRALKIKEDVAPKAAKDTLPNAGEVGKAALRFGIQEGIGALYPPARPVAMAAAAIWNAPSIAKLVYDTVRSPAWQTTSAVIKKQLAQAIAAKDFDTAGLIAHDVIATQPEPPQTPQTPTRAPLQLVPQPAAPSPYSGALKVGQEIPTVGTVLQVSPTGKSVLVMTQYGGKRIVMLDQLPDPETITAFNFTRASDIAAKQRASGGVQ